MPVISGISNSGLSGYSGATFTFLSSFLVTYARLVQKKDLLRQVLFQRYKSTPWICDMPFGRVICLRRVIYLQAWVDLYHITFRVSEKYHVCRKANISHPASAGYHTERVYGPSPTGASGGQFCAGSGNPAVVSMCPSSHIHSASAPNLSASALPSATGSRNREVERASAAPESGQITVTI